MATGTREQAATNAFVVVGLIIAAPALLSPLYVGMLETSDQKTARQLDTNVERVRRRISQLNEQLNYTRELREQLAAGGVALTSDGTIKAAESPGGTKALEQLELDLREGKKLRVDKILEDATQRTPAADRHAYAKGLGSLKSGSAAFQELQKQIAANDKQIKDAESEIKAALSEAGSISSKSGEDVWAQRTAAMVSWIKARQALDSAWLDRWQAAELRTRARNQMIEVANLRRMAMATTGATLDDAVQIVRGDKSKAEKDLKATRDEVSQLQSQIAELREKIDALRKEAARARADMAQMDVKPFKPSDSLKAGAEFEQFRSRYESLSDAARKAESQADTLEFGALQGGSIMEVNEGDILTAKYDGGTSVAGLVALEAQLAARQKLADDLAANVQNQEDAIKSLTDRSTARDNAKQAFSQKADQAATDADKTVKDIVKLMASAAQSEDTARKALADAEKSALAAQNGAKARINKASELKRNLASEQPSQRLAAIINDKESESTALVLAANMAWMRAELTVQAIADAQAQQRLLDTQSKLLGIQATEDIGARIAKWREDARKDVQTALDKLKAAKAVIATASYDDVDGQRVTGTALRWQVAQLEGATHLLEAFLADTEELANDARAKARLALQEAVNGREGSPLLQTADSTLKLIQ